ncbi:MAG: hypothetical protein HQL26_09160 [Candidatus Omnitrophica bacterium]|nr:hypothetical protein [Candidatus Omnitrophota bacterium]
MQYARVFEMTQLDKIILTLSATCILPVLVHLIPFFAADIGRYWLPIFYAPLVAALCFRPQVAITASLLGPMVNHALLRMPSYPEAQFLTSELMIFSAVILILRKFFKPQGWAVILAFIFANAVSSSIFWHTDWAAIGQGVAHCWPGLLALVILTEGVNYLRKENA